MRPPSSWNQEDLDRRSSSNIGNLKPELLENFMRGGNHNCQSATPTPECINITLMITLIFVYQYLYICDRSGERT